MAFNLCITVTIKLLTTFHSLLAYVAQRQLLVCLFV